MLNARFVRLPYSCDTNTPTMANFKILSLKQITHRIPEHLTSGSSAVMIGSPRTPLILQGNLLF